MASRTTPVGQTREPPTCNAEREPPYIGPLALNTGCSLSESQLQIDGYCTGGTSPPAQQDASVTTATPNLAGRRGAVPKRRFQKGTFVKRRGNWVGMWR